MHTCPRGGGQFASDIKNILGVIGVPIFFILSGFLFKRSDKTSCSQFWRKKSQSIMIPWLICGIVTFLFSVLLGAEISVINVVKWILGVHTWYYYLPMLFACYLLFSIFHSTAWLFVSVGISCISLTITQLRIWKMPFPITDYLNVLNWMGFFAIGIIFRRFYREGIISRFQVILSAILFLVTGVLYVFLPIEKTYWNTYLVVFALCAFFFIYCISYVLSDIRVLRDIGKKSYFIYLIHMQIAGIICTKFPLPLSSDIQTIIKPIIAWVVVYGLVLVLEKILQIIHMEKLSVMLGIRT